MASAVLAVLVGSGLLHAERTAGAYGLIAFSVAVASIVMGLLHLTKFEVKPGPVSVALVWASLVCELTQHDKDETSRRDSRLLRRNQLCGRLVRRGARTAATWATE